MAEESERAPSTRRLRAAKPATSRFRRTADGTAEVVTAGPEQEDSAVRRRVAPGPSIRRGLSLKWKIAAAMSSVTFVAGVLIFIVVYNKAVDQLNDEINAKGERLVLTLASVDEEYWHTAIHWPDRQAEFHLFLRKLDPQFDWEKTVEAVPENQRAVVPIINPTSEARRDEVRQVISKLLKREDWYDGVKDTPEFERLLSPIGRLDRINPFESLKGAGSEDLVDVGVVDVSDPNLKPNDPAPVVTMKGVSRITLKLPEPKPGEVISVAERDAQHGGRTTRVRLFVKNPDPQSKVKLRHYAMLSLEKISDAKTTLFWSVFLTVLLAVAVSIAVAMGLSALVTKPLALLLQDMHEVSSGNLDHETVPISTDEIGVLAGTFNKMTGALKTAHEHELEQKRMEHQLSIAREIQENLMPKKIPKFPGYDVGAFYRPSQEVGGDYYDFIDIDQDHTGLIVADVSGKGVPGAIVMSMALAFIREEVDRTRNLSPMATLVRANKMLAQNIKKGMFVTAIYCILDKRNRAMKVASAGHNPLIVWRAGKSNLELVNPKGIALGFDRGPVFERTIEEGSLVLDHGDRIVAYTDGAIEAMNAAHEEFGDPRFHALVRQLADRDCNQFLNLVVKALDDHKGAAPQHDDITLVALRYL